MATKTETKVILDSSNEAAEFKTGLSTVTYKENSLMPETNPEVLSKKQVLRKMELCGKPDEFDDTATVLSMSLVSEIAASHSALLLDNARLRTELSAAKQTAWQIGERVGFANGLAQAIRDCRTHLRFDDFQHHLFSWHTVEDLIQEWGKLIRKPAEPTPFSWPLIDCSDLARRNEELYRILGLDPYKAYIEITRKKFNLPDFQPRSREGEK